MVPISPFPTIYTYINVLCVYIFSGESVVLTIFINKNMTKEVKNHCSRLRNGNNRCAGSKSSI